jgi:hypothetical protein
VVKKFPQQPSKIAETLFLLYLYLYLSSFFFPLVRLLASLGTPRSRLTKDKDKNKEEEER